MHIPTDVLEDGDRYQLERYPHRLYRHVASRVVRVHHLDAKPTKHWID